MIRFECDYTEGAHPRIMERMVRTNMEQTEGYGCDPHCLRAAEYIRRDCKAPDAAVHFLVGGTQANKTIIAHALRPHQGVISAMTGHINVHETGAIEATGHRVLALTCGPEGKLSAAQIRDAVQAHWADATHEHQPQPAMVYLSHPTENGTLYTRQELKEISDVCRSLGLYLFLDGARLGYGLMSEGTDLTLPDIAALCDVFYIGGTKVGALFGEAVVITAPALQKDFRYMIKHEGGMLAKGRLLGIQFETLFEDGLYYEIAKHADQMAYRIRDAFAEKGYSFLCESTTNQQFPILPDSVLEQLQEKYAFSFWSKIDETHNAVRFCTSWATLPENVDALIRDIPDQNA